MKRKLKCLMLSVICCVSMLAMPWNASALDRYVDTDILVDNINDIADWIESYGFTNTEDDPAISYDKNSNEGGFITVQGDCLEFGYFCKGRDSSQSYVYMYVDFPYSEHMRTEANIFIIDRNGNTNGGVWDAVATVDPSDYRQYDQSVYFAYNKDDCTVNNGTAQRWCNEVFDDAIDLWDELLDKKMDMSVVQLGFSEICNHDWDDALIERPTANEEGEVESTCQWCGKIKTTYVPADSWSVKGKTASVKYSTLKKKSVTISRQAAVSLSGCDYRDITYKKISGNSKIAVNSKNGKITVKKGLKKGSYKLKVKVMSASGVLYDASEKAATVTIKVK